MASFKSFSSRGMSFRTTKDIFQDKSGNCLTFNQAILLPSSGGSYLNKEETLKNVCNITNNKNIKIEKIINSPNKAAMIVVLSNDDNKQIGFVKYFGSINVDGKGKWTEKTFAEETGTRRNSNNLKLCPSEVEAIPLKPSSLVGDENKRTAYELIEHVLRQIKTLSFHDKLPLNVICHVEQIMESILNGHQSPVLKDGYRYASAYDKHLGEVLAPLALLMKWNTENDDTCRFDDSMKVSFNLMSNDRLIDSKIYLSDNETVGVSFKSGRGAAASVSTLNDVFAQMNEQSQSNFVKSYPFLKDVIEIITKQNSIDGPIELAARMNLVTLNDIELLQTIKKDIHISLEAFRKNIVLTDNLLQVVNGYKNISPYNIENEVPGYEPILHVISGLAKAVARRLNEKEELKTGIRELLQNANLIQVSSKIKHCFDNKNDIKFDKFVIKHPFDTKGIVSFNSSKNYTSTRIRGKISFKII